jgi:hypothetical protein
MPLRLSLALLAISLVSIVSSVAAQSNPPAPGPQACGALYVGREINIPFTAP